MTCPCDALGRRRRRPNTAVTPAVPAISRRRWCSTFGLLAAWTAVFAATSPFSVFCLDTVGGIFTSDAEAEDFLPSALSAGARTRAVPTDGGAQAAAPVPSDLPYCDRGLHLRRVAK